MEFRRYEIETAIDELIMQLCVLPSTSHQKKKKKHSLVNAPLQGIGNSDLTAPRELMGKAPRGEAAAAGVSA